MSVQLWMFHWRDWRGPLGRAHIDNVLGTNGQSGMAWRKINTQLLIHDVIAVNAVPEGHANRPGDGSIW